MKERWPTFEFVMGTIVIGMAFTLPFKWLVIMQLVAGSLLFISGLIKIYINK